MRTLLRCKNSLCKFTIAHGMLVVMLAGGLLILTYQKVFGHAGHGTEEVSEYDLDAPRKVSSETARHIGLKIGLTEIRSISEVIEISGVVKPLPDKHRLVVSRTAGRLLSIEKQVGDKVATGDLLARIDSPEFAKNLYEARKLAAEYQELLLEIERAQASTARRGVAIEIAQAEATYLEADVKRLQSIAGAGVPQKDVVARTTELARAQGELKFKQIDLALNLKENVILRERADALQLSQEALLAINNLDPKVELVQQATGQYEIRAESDGIVIRRLAIPGQWLNPGESILAVADHSIMQIEGEVPESLIARLRQSEHNKVRIRTASDPTYVGEGIVRYIAPQLDITTRTAHLIVEAPNPDNTLLGEMWVVLSVVIRETDKALVVPRSAVVVQGPMHFVFLENGDAFQKQDIEPGATDDQYVQVKSGLAPGDSVVIEGAYSLTQLRPKVKAK